MRDEKPEFIAESLDRPSKSQRKREALALQDLGATLVTLKPAQLDKIPLPEELREAVLAARQMTQRGARKRQLQYIGRLMREIDPEPIHVAMGLPNPPERGPS
jgi:ribosome-associated protein